MEDKYDTKPNLPSDCCKVSYLGVHKQMALQICIEHRSESKKHQLHHSESSWNIFSDTKLHDCKLQPP